MKKTLGIFAAAVLGLSGAAAREANLINNSAFGHGMKCWKHTGAGGVEKLAKGIRLTGGVLAHYLDLGNLEHAQIECAAPAGRQYRFRVKVKGQGTLRLGVRARLMYGGCAVEFLEQWSEPLALTGAAQEVDFEAATTDPDAVFHDKLMIKPGENSVMEITGTSFYYLDRKGPQLTFFPAAAAVRPGDTVKVTVQSSQPHLRLTSSLYCGQFTLGGYYPVQHGEVVCDADGKAEVTFTVPYEAPDGVRLTLLDKNSGVKAHFLATILPEKMMQTYRDYGRQISGRQHLLFIGDSLSDYDRGRNYISTAGCFLPTAYSIRNCGVGGDTLLRIWQRLQGKKTTRNYMYDRIFDPKPDTVFIFAGANDSKIMSATGKTYLPENQQPELWENIITHIKKQTGAKIVLITSPDSYLPYQKALNLPLKAQNFSHSFFGLPDSHDRFNARLRAIAAKYKLDVIDFAAVVRAHHDPQTLYVQDDGVHMSLKGHQLLAGEILRYLAGKDLTKINL